MQNKFFYISKKLIFLNSKKCSIEKQRCTVDVNFQLTARWRKQKTKNVRNISLISEKHLMLRIQKYQNWMTPTWGVTERPNSEKFLSQKKDYLAKVPEQFESFIFADDKSVAAVNGTAENKENQSVQTQN